MTGSSVGSMEQTMGAMGISGNARAHARWWSVVMAALGALLLALPYVFSAAALHLAFVGLGFGVS